MHGAQAHWLPDGRRLHLNHGPIDLIVEAFGDPDEVRAAYEQVVARFRTILPELVEELPELRRASIRDRPRDFRGGVARRMEAAVAPLADIFLTPMAAVAGAVADETMAALTQGRRLRKAYVNNGGDTVLHLTPGARIDIAVAATSRGLSDRITIRADDPVRGLATSGWRGRSFSLGIADAVTVLAQTAAEADAAATVIANAVDLPGHPAVQRRPARDLAPDSDLGDRLVTTGVGALARAEVEEALGRGLAVAETLRGRGVIASAALFLSGEAHVCGAITGSPGAELPPSSPPAISPSRREIGSLCRRASLSASVIGEIQPAGSISPFEGEMAGRPEGGAEGCRAANERSKPLPIPQNREALHA
jgi:ApbE superfamily uncharacterized protein (UPF0280 family)